MRRAALLAATIAALVAAAPGAALAASPSLVDIEDEVMCVSCNVPLNIAESAQANRQREFIRQLIADGRDKEQVKDALVAEYGEDVLALPDDDGFGLTAYAVPIALLALLAAGLAVLVPRWRRRRPAPTFVPGGAEASLDAGDARRLDEDLARYDR